MANDNNKHFKLIMRQQPKFARACGNGIKDRRAVDPVIVAWFLGSNCTSNLRRYWWWYSSLFVIAVNNRLEKHLMLILHINLWIIGPQNEKVKADRQITGSIVSSPTILRDNHGNFRFTQVLMAVSLRLLTYLSGSGGNSNWNSDYMIFLVKEEPYPLIALMLLRLFGPTPSLVWLQKTILEW